VTVEKLFWVDPYLTETNANVVTITQNKITLNKTVAYAMSGGQDSDSGSIGGYEIITAQKQGKDIVYTISSQHNLDVGDNVIVNIDWEKRYQLMRLHFAAELVLELVYQNYDKPNKIGANITKDKARLDFEWQGNISEIFPFLQSELTKLVKNDFEIISDYSDKLNQRRYWEITGFAKVPCGGTHLKSTGEIGELCLKRKNIGAGKERIEIILA
jgi:Ser-tRNA(Ala) deacylase AlaX